VLQTLLQHSIRTKRQLGLCFIDLERAYDSVNRTKLWDVLVESLHLPADLVQIIKNMYVDSKGMCFDNLSGEWLEFLTNIGVK
jgi:hypothetical protein